MELAGQRNHIALRGAALGVLLFLITVLIAFLLPSAWALDAFAALLGFIGAIYVGMAVAQGKQVVFQFVVAVGFLFTGLLGLWLSPWILVAGYFAHGLWDWLHHPNHLFSARKKTAHKMSVKLTKWYAPFCLVYDWLVGFAIAIWWIL